MTLMQLRYFQMVCKLNSISKASEALHVSQPAVSIAISNLETEFGMTFFHRDNRMLTITDAGHTFLTLTNEVLASVDSMYLRMRTLRDSSRVLRLSVVPFSFSRQLQPILQEFRANSPDIPVQVFEHTANEAMQRIKNNLVDLALTIDLQDHPSYIDGLRLFKAPVVFAVSENHPMADRQSCCFADLAAESLIFTKEDSFLTKQVKAKFHEKGITPKVSLYTAQSNLIESALQSGSDGAIISENLAGQIQNVRLIPIQDAVEITHLLLWKRTAHLPPAAAKFIKTIRAFYADARPY